MRTRVPTGSLRGELGKTGLHLFASYSYAAFGAVLLVVLLAVNIAFDPTLLNPADIMGPVSTLAPLTVLAMAQTPPVLSGNGGIDLSLGTFAGLCTVLIGTFLNSGALGSTYVVIPLVLCLGIVLGLVNGLLVTVIRLQPIIATLGTYLIVSGLADHYAPGSGGRVERWVADISGSIVDVAIIALVILGWLVLQRTRYFTLLLAVGRDDRTAYASGVPVTRVRTLAYVLGGLIAAVAGLLLTALIGGADSTVGPSYTLTSIAAVALGGTSLAGGRGGILGSIIGALTIFFIENLLTLANVSVFTLNLAYGLILVAALVANAAVARRGLLGGR
jgi:ribose transport system permease protein